MSPVDVFRQPAPPTRFLHRYNLTRPRKEQVEAMSSESIPKTQTVALVRELGGAVEFQDDYPVPVPGHNEVLAKVLYSGVCQSGEYNV
jgi:hypothetical protein